MKKKILLSSLVCLILLLGISCTNNRNDSPNSLNNNKVNASISTDNLQLVESKKFYSGEKSIYNESF